MGLEKFVMGAEVGLADSMAVAVGWDVVRISCAFFWLNEFDIMGVGEIYGIGVYGSGSD